MTPTAVALLAYASWTLVIVMSLGTYRTFLVQTKGRSANSFDPSGEGIGDFGYRLTRAHANCYENLPIAATIMLYAIATQQTAATDGLAYAFIFARIAQTLTHIASTSNAAVLIRFGFYLAQLGILIIWLMRLFGHI